VSLLIVNEDTYISPIEHPRYLSSTRISRERRVIHNFSGGIVINSSTISRCGGRAAVALRHLKSTRYAASSRYRMWSRLNGRHVDPELSFPRTAISLATLRDINMLLRKDSLMKVDKDCKNMSRASRRLRGVAHTP